MNTHSASVEILVFDIGGVIIFHDNDLLLNRLLSRMSRPPSASELLKTIRNSGIGIGASSVSQLWSLFVTRFDWSGSYEDFLSDWSSHFTPNELMLGDIRSIGTAHPVILCSNTNREHWSALCGRYPLSSLCEHAVLSFEVGIEKPDPGIFDHVTRTHPSATRDAFLFVDDNAENIESARAYGFQVHHYRNHSLFASDGRVRRLFHESSRHP